MKDDNHLAVARVFPLFEKQIVMVHVVAGELSLEAGSGRSSSSAMRQE